MKKEIKLGEKTYRVGFDFSTLLEIEDEFGMDFQNVFEKILNNKKRSTTDLLRFLYACVKSFNDDVCPFREWLHEMASVRDMTALNAAITDAQKAFFLSPRGASEPEREKAEDSKKNE